MLMKLSLRNAKRQFNEYALFFVTLTCAVASMYAFNALIFSDTVKALPDMELLPYLIVVASLLIMGFRDIVTCARERVFCDIATCA